MVNMLVLGDAWEGDYYHSPYYGLDRESGVSEVSGYGRLHAHWPSDENLSAPWGWGWQLKHINQGEMLTWCVGSCGAESMDVTQWKWAVAQFELDTANFSEIIIMVTDICNNNALMGADVSYDFRKRIHLRAERIGGKCLAMKAYAIVTPPGGAWFYSADYFHSGDPVYH